LGKDVNKMKQFMQDPLPFLQELSGKLKKDTALERVKIEFSKEISPMKFPPNNRTPLSV
jgi:hypothetical protein